MNELQFLPHCWGKLNYTKFPSQKRCSNFDLKTNEIWKESLVRIQTTFSWAADHDYCNDSVLGAPHLLLELDLSAEISLSQSINLGIWRRALDLLFPLSYLSEAPTAKKMGEDFCLRKLTELTRSDGSILLRTVGSSLVGPAIWQ